MKKMFFAAVIALACVTLTSRGQTTYEVKGSFPVQLSLWYPAQILPEDYSVTGLNLPYGYNEHVVGLDLGIYGAGRVMDAIQVNVMNDVVEQIAGWQLGAINRSGSLAGIQSGLLNFVDLEVSGTQVGIINKADDVAGLQVGIINTCESMYGVQIGLVNIIAESSVPFMIGINCAF